MVKLDHIKHTIVLAEGVTASVAENVITLAKESETICREFVHPRVSATITSESIEVFCDLPRRKDRALAGTWAAHLRNMNRGLSEGFEYRLKAVFSHFPMNLKVEGKQFTISNLFGEKVPRVAKLPWTPAEVEVRVENKTDVVVKGADREKVGQTAANIESACRITKRDRRVFQDGVYIVSKGA